MRSFAQEVRSSLRAFGRSRVFAVLAVLYLALGIGGNTAIFSVVNNVLFRPFPYQDDQRLVWIWDKFQSPESPPRISTTPFNYFAYRSTSTSFEGIGALAQTSFTLEGGGEPVRVRGAEISPNLLSVLGVKLLRGRGLNEEEGRPGAANVALLGHDLWNLHFGADEGLLGSQVNLNGESYTVIGVLPPGFQVPAVEAQVWVPLKLDPDDSSRRQRRAHYLFVVARLRSDVSAEQSQAELQTITQRLAQEYPDTHEGWGAVVLSFRGLLVENIQTVVLAVQIAVGFVLLIACANVICLLLVRAEQQSNDVAIRTALGADRRSLLQRSFAEGLILALMGGTLGCLLATWAIRPLMRLSPLASFPLIDFPSLFRNTGVDHRVFGAAFVATILAGLFCGLVPAFQRFDSNTFERLKQGRRGAGNVRGHRLLKFVVIAEVALTITLLVGAGLMLKSLHRLYQDDPGFDSENALTLRLALADSRYSEAHQRNGFLSRALESIEGLPGVVAAGATSILPLEQSRPFVSTFTPEGYTPASSSEALFARYYLTSPQYLKAMGISVLEGRYFTELDDDQAPGVVAISQAMAELYWPHQSPIGKRFKRGRPESQRPWLTVVGVVENVKDGGLFDDFAPVFYLPYPQHAASQAANEVTLVISTVAKPGQLTAAVRGKLSEIDESMVAFDISTLEKRLEDSLSRSRLSSFLLNVFASFALLLVLIGVFGIVSFFVGQRRREMGIRMALGAQRRDILKLVMAQGIFLVLGGLIFGLAAATVLTRLLANQLYRVSPMDPLAIFGASLILLGVAGIASYLPASRATRIHPIAVLRDE